MENHFDLRVDPTKLVPGAKSVITFLMNYFPKEQQMQDVPKIARYAWGEDYHEVIRAKLKTILSKIEEKTGEINGRGFVDSAPVLERAWALRSGLGWVGKNGNLITKSTGSYFFIATLIIDLDLHYDDPFVKDYCGSCTRCIEACPTEAILPNKVVDGGKCISYFTIELKDNLPQEMKGKFDDWMFGCDICQDVCPWNKFSKPHNEPLFDTSSKLLSFTKKDWEEITEDVFKKVFKNSAVKRTKFEGLKRNIEFLK
jgi:epoxyqueuosine reductase